MDDSVSESSPVFEVNLHRVETALWFGRLQLMQQCIRLIGWNLQGRYQRVIALDEVQNVQWWTGMGEYNFALDLLEKQVFCDVDGAGRLKFRIEQQLSNCGRSVGLPNLHARKKPSLRTVKTGNASGVNESQDKRQSKPNATGTDTERSLPPRARRLSWDYEDGELNICVTTEEGDRLRFCLPTTSGELSLGKKGSTLLQQVDLREAN